MIYGMYADFTCSWGWLVKRKDGELDIVTTKDQDPVVGGVQVVFGVDMWEHAYYIQVLSLISLPPYFRLLTASAGSTLTIKRRMST